MKESLLGEILGVGKVISEAQRAEILATLRATHTDLDDRREPKTVWRRGNIYFHSLEDTNFANWSINQERHDVIRRVQACFVKDLDDYIERFPESEDSQMRQLFQTVFDVGTSVYWDHDMSFLKDFDKLYWELDKKVIRPWAQAAMV